MKLFRQADPHLSPLVDLPLVHPLEWWRDVDWNEPGILILTGGRQIGKSTSTKLLIQSMIDEQRFPAEDIFYLPCDLLEDKHKLVRLVRDFTAEREDREFLLVLDEITFVSGWNMAIKALADEGRFRRGFALLTGSDTVMLKEAASSFPGRRGEAARVDFHLYPLSFREYVELAHPKKVRWNDDDLLQTFEAYLSGGGMLRAINDIARHGAVREATFTTFEQWIRGDATRRGKKTRLLEEVLAAVYMTTPTQVTYSTLARRTDGLAKDTVLDYLEMLRQMDVLFDLPAFDQNTGRGFPKKARKLHFADPFISEVVGRWLVRERYASRTLDVSIKVEASVAAHYRRRSPVYYIKGKGEVDLVVVEPDGFTPIETKWAGQFRGVDLKQLSKLKGGLVLSRYGTGGSDTIHSEVLPRHLLAL
ncbi:MAG: ATP-binding protein [Proteobacteria bacterium]|nr:ATP-binding protein [Pseudomonadota bacterium]